MTTIITTPRGEEIKIDGTKVCVASSPDKCWEEHPDMIKLRLDVAWHEGWPIRKGKDETE